MRVAAARSDRESVLHIVVGPSAAGSLMRGLRDSGRTDQVACFPDDLSFGPIDPPDPVARREWIGRHLGVEWEDISPQTDFWEQILSWPGRRLSWLSRHSAREYAGFLEILRRLDDRPVNVIDITDADISYGPRLRSNQVQGAKLVAHLQPEAFLRPDVLGMRQPLTAADRNRHLDVWHRLREENAPLRVIEDLIPVSKPLDYFDPMLLSLGVPQWRKLARLVGGALAQAAVEGHEDLSEFVVTARLVTFVETGALIGRAMDRTWHEAEIRLPNRNC